MSQTLTVAHGCGLARRRSPGRADADATGQRRQEGRRRRRWSAGSVPTSGRYPAPAGSSGAAARFRPRAAGQPGTHVDELGPHLRPRGALPARSGALRRSRAGGPATPQGRLEGLGGHRPPDGEGVQGGQPHRLGRAALTYYAILSLVPALIALVSIVGARGRPEERHDTLTKIVSSIGPPPPWDTFKTPIEQVTANRSGAGLALVVSLAAALWSASGYIGAFMRASNAIYEVDEGRPFWKLRPVQLLVTLVLVLLAALVLLSLVVTGRWRRASATRSASGRPP